MTVKFSNLFSKFTIVCCWVVVFNLVFFLKKFQDYSHLPIGDGSQTDNYVHPDWKRRINKDHCRVFGASIKCRNLGVWLLHRLHRQHLPHPSSSGSISFIVSIEGIFRYRLLCDCGILCFGNSIGVKSATLQMQVVQISNIRVWYSEDVWRWCAKQCKRGHMWSCLYASKSQFVSWFLFKDDAIQN